MFTYELEFSTKLHSTEQKTVKYSNGKYDLYFDYRTKSGRLHKPTDPQDTSQMDISFITKDRKKHPIISASIRKIGSDRWDDTMICFPLVQHKWLEKMENETGAWRDAQDAVYEANDLVKELFPGYCITEVRRR